MSTEKNPSESQFVIIRAFGDEPVRLRVIEISRNAVIVSGSDSTISMPFHLNRAYRFDNKLYQKMRSEFEAGHRETLASIWETAPPFTRTAS
jgi:hypothetical protein